MKFSEEILIKLSETEFKNDTVVDAIGLSMGAMNILIQESLDETGDFLELEDTLTSKVVQIPGDGVFYKFIKYL